MNQFEFEGTLTAITDKKSGEGKNGEWALIKFKVTEDKDDYPQSCVFSMIKSGEYIDNVKKFSYKKGDKMKVFFNLDTSDYKGKSYNDIKAWKVEGESSGKPTKEEADKEHVSEEGIDDLPF